MKCHTDCAYNQGNECTRDTKHINSATCRDRTIPKQYKKNRGDPTLNEVKK
jgi:hypothetical protein